MSTSQATACATLAGLAVRAFPTDRFQTGYGRGVSTSPALAALLGGECTGKSTLGAGLAEKFDGVVVPEKLRQFVETVGRPPTRDEQSELMNAQIAAERASVDHAVAAGRTLIIADPAVLMTAIYSIVYFDDDSLLSVALAHQLTYELTVLCGSEIPWRADGAQRDGQEFRERTTAVIERIVTDYELPVLRVAGPLDERLAAVSNALTSLQIGQ